MKMKMKKQAKYRVKYFTDDLEDILQLLVEETIIDQHAKYTDYDGILIVAKPGDTVKSLRMQYFTKCNEKILRYYQSARDESIQYRNMKALKALEEDDDIEYLLVQASAKKRRREQQKYRLRTYPRDCIYDVVKEFARHLQTVQHPMYFFLNDVLVVGYPGDSEKSLYLQYKQKRKEVFQKYIESATHMRYLYLYNLERSKRTKERQFIRGLIRDEEFQIKTGKETEYEERMNGHTTLVLKYADRLARALQVRIREGLELGEALGELLLVCDWDLILTEDMVHRVFAILKDYWKYGDVLANWLETPLET